MKPEIKRVAITKLKGLSGMLMVSSLALFPLAKFRTGNLRGWVVDCENNLPLKNVRLVVTERHAGTEFPSAETDTDACHRLGDLPTNTEYGLESKRAIYEAREIEVRIGRAQDNEAPRVWSEETEVSPLQSTPITSPCGPIFFPLNSKRLNDEHQACLDEIALRLQQESSASLVVDGHRGKSRVGKLEQQSISRTRANNARDYLVKEKGVDAARITVRDFTNACANESGDRNLDRRVEFWIVPEGRNASDANRMCIAKAKPRIAR